MNTLPLEFSYDQFHFRQLARAGDVVLLEKRKPGHSWPTYEIVILQRHPAQTIQGRQYPDRESMPPSELWGEAGWTCMDLRTAEARYRQLVATRG